MNFGRRLKAFVYFMVKATKLAFKQDSIDLVIATSTPLTIGVPALFLKWFKKIPFIFEVRDLWPEVPIQMGAIKNSLLKAVLRYFEKTIYRNAEHVVTLSPGMRDGVLKYISQKKVSMIPNMPKIDEFWPRDKNEILIEKLSLNKDTFKIVHFGALGIANGAKTIIESAKILKNDSTVEFLFLGGGSTESSLKKMCAESELDNVKFLGNFPMETNSEIVNFSDLSVVSFQDIPILYTNSPNKFFDSLSAGKPIIVNSKGWTKEIVESENCGYYVDPNKPFQLVEKIKYLQENPDVVQIMSLNSRRLAETKYDKSILVKQFSEVVDEVIHEIKLK